MSAPASTRTSLWAIASLACGVLACPPLCLLAPILGIIGLAQVRSRPGITGRRLAVAGIVLGLLASGGWGAFSYWWHLNIRTPLLVGPRDALVTGLAGDVDGFRAAFQDPASPEEAAMFLAEVTNRYGALLEMRQDATPPEDGAQQMLDRVRPVVRYHVRFVGESVSAEAQFVLRDGRTWVLRWGGLTIRDAERGDLTYPVAAIRATQ